MSLRRVAVALAAPVLALATTTVPASADVVAANQGLAGAIAVAEELAGGFSIRAGCTFGGVLTPANTLIVGFGGTAQANGPAGRTAPLLTAAFCEINNHSEGGTESQTSEFSTNGTASATASSTLLATSGPKEWPVKDITVCVSAFAIWGPTPVTKVDLARRCITPNG